MIATHALEAAASERAGEPVRVVRRGGSPGGDAADSEAYFERVRLQIGDREQRAVLKVPAPDPCSPPHERSFYETLAADVACRVPAPFATGPLPGSADGWILMGELPRRRQRAFWRHADALACVREIARLHAQHLGRAPDALPRPLTSDLARYLAHVPDGITALRERMARRPALRWLVSERELARAVELAADPAPLVRALAASPETVIHRDFHPGNVAVPRRGRPIVFDWEDVAAGPPVFDLTLFHQYLGYEWLRVPGVGVEWLRHREPRVAWLALRAAYVDTLCAAAEAPVDVDAILAAESAARTWEAVYRLGWIDARLEARDAWLARAGAWPPGLRAGARWRAGWAELRGRRAVGLDVHALASGARRSETSP